MTSMLITVQQPFALLKLGVYVLVNRRREVNLLPSRGSIVLLLVSSNGFLVKRIF